jgi:hypothetical protein
LRFSAVAPPPNGVGCYYTDPPALYFTLWIPVLMFETFLCILMLFKAGKMYKDSNNFPLLKLLVRDRCVSCGADCDIASSTSSRERLNNSADRSVHAKLNSIFATLLVNCLIWELDHHISPDIAIV